MGKAVDSLFSLVDAPAARLLHRNQFIIGPRFVETPEDWKRVRVGRSLYLTAHPDLNLLQVTDGAKSIALLGFMLDPYDPTCSDGDILDRLLHELTTCDQFLPHTDNIGGRWALVVDDGSQLVLFHDPLGQRQVFYTDIHLIEDLWCASQPGNIADLLGLHMDKDAVSFVDSCKRSGIEEYWFPADTSPFQEIRRLLPNHYLDLGTGKMHRYWPSKALDRIGLDAAVERTSKILRGLLAGAARRFSLQLDLTAGLDTRIVLAASREIRDDVTYMTLKTRRMSEDFADLTVAAKLASKLCLRHDIVVSASVVNPSFLDIFKRNVTLAHDVYVPDAQAILEHYRLTKVCVTGTASEVGKFEYTFGKLGDRRTTPQELSRLAEMGTHPFSVKAFRGWLWGLGELYGLDLFRLFYWENRCANWLAMTQQEFDIAYLDTLSPFNCREVLTMVFALNEECRKSPEFVFYRQLIYSMWPDALTVPINPHKTPKFDVMKRSFLDSIRLVIESGDPRYFFPT